MEEEGTLWADLGDGSMQVERCLYREYLEEEGTLWADLGDGSMQVIRKPLSSSYSRQHVTMKGEKTPSSSHSSFRVTDASGH